MILKKLFKTAMLVAIFTLVTGFALMLSACGGNNDGKGSGEDKAPVIEVTAETIFVGDFNDQDIKDGIKVVVVNEDGSKREIEFEVKSATVTEDGAHIDIVVVAGGVEKTVTAKYVPAQEEIEEKVIREDLMPIYEKLAEDGDKSFSFTLICFKNVGEEVSTFTLTANVNILSDGKIEFEVLDEEEKVLVAYKDLSVYAFGVAFDLGEVFEKVMEEISPFIPEDLDLEEYGFEKIDGLTEDVNYDDALRNAFLTVSEVLDIIDGLIDSPIISNIVSITKENGVYSASVTTKTLADIAPMIVTLITGNEDIVPDVVEIIDVADKLLNGAIKSGDISLNVTFGIADDSAHANIAVKDATTNTAYGITVTALINEDLAVIEIPEVEETEPEPEIEEPEEIKDLELSVSFALPQANIDANAKLVIHTTNFEEGAGKDFVSALVTLNKEDALRFVLNDGYVFIDVSGLVNFINEGEEYVALYYEFDIDGEPASLTDGYLEYLVKTAIEEIVAEEEIEDGDVAGDIISEDIIGDDIIEDDDDEDEYPYIYAYYDCGLAFPIGTTESEIRETLHVFYVKDSESGDGVELTDYVITELDTSARFEGNFVITGENLLESMQIIIYNPETCAHRLYALEDFAFETGYVAVVEKGSAISDVSVLATVKHIDGNIAWDTIENATIVKVNGEAVTEEYVFTNAGDYVVVCGYNNAELTGKIHVYDPENLVLVGLDVIDTVYAEEGVTEQELRDTIGYIGLIYDDYNFESQQLVEDYEINGLTEGATEIEVKYGTVAKTVAIEYESPYSPEDEDEFTIAKLAQYFRFVDLNQEDTAEIIKASFNNLKNVIETNKDLITGIVNVEKSENGFVVTLAVNNEKGEDLFAVLNLFVGIPSGDDFSDIDENVIYGLLTLAEFAGLVDLDQINSVCDKCFGTDLLTIMTNLSVSVGCNFDDEQLSLFVAVDDGGKIDYLSVGASIRATEKAESLVISAEDITKAMTPEDFADYFEDMFEDIFKTEEVA